MRTILYYVIDKDTKKVVDMTAQGQAKAEAMLEELKAKNKNGNYSITYKWANI